MEHLILTETDFFRLIDNPGSTGLGTAYNEFRKRQQAVPVVAARKRMDMHGKQTMEGRHGTDSLRTENTSPPGGDVRKMNARYVQKVNVRSDSEQKMRRREKLQKIFLANISLNISKIYPCEKKNTPAGPLFVP